MLLGKFWAAPSLLRKFLLLVFWSSAGFFEVAGGEAFGATLNFLAKKARSSSLLHEERLESIQVGLLLEIHGNATHATNHS